MYLLDLVNMIVNQQAKVFPTVLYVGVALEVIQDSHHPRHVDLQSYTMRLWMDGRFCTVVQSILNRQTKMMTHANKPR